MEMSNVESAIMEIRDFKSERETNMNKLEAN